MESVDMMSQNHSESEDSDIYSRDYSESMLSTSPSEKLWLQIIHHPLAWRMHALYGSNTRCLVENTVYGNALLYVHCLSWRLESRRVTALEYAWGVQCGSLNLNTHLNVFCLSPNYKDFWETFKWFLLPEDGIIHQFHDAAMNNQTLPDVGEGPYNYRLVAHPDMKSIAIHRQIIFPDVEIEDLKPEHFMFCAYPFNNIGAITCHLHPKFIICHIGWMVSRTDDTFLLNYANAHPDSLKLISMILQICNQWTRPLDKADPKHRAFFDNKIDPDDIISETYTRTGNGRIKPHINQKRLNKCRNGVKRKRTGSLVSMEKLRMLDEHLIVQNEIGGQQ